MKATTNSFAMATVGSTKKGTQPAQIHDQAIAVSHCLGVPMVTLEGN